MTAYPRKAAAVVAAGAAVLIGLAVAFSHGADRRDASASSTNPAANGAPRTVQSVRAANADNRGARKTGDKPYWRTLTPAQQLALQPLQGEWDAMDGVRKQKWLQLADRFSALPADDQARMQERMRAWVKLTPEQRELARETYSRSRKITPDQKTATWESYQLLTDEQKRTLAASVTTRKAPSVVPSQANAKVVAPLNQGAAACPAGTVRNSVSATPPCVSPGLPGTLPPAAPVAPPAGTPATPASPQQQQQAPEKPEPANWGITPNNA